MTVVVLLDRPPLFDDLRQRVRECTESFPRLRQRVAEPSLGFGLPRWVDATDFDLDAHVHLVNGGGTDTRGVLALAAQSARNAIERTAPLWQIMVVDEMEGGTAAVILKFHHSLTDGVGGMELMLSLLDWSRDPGGHIRSEPPPVAPARGSLLGQLLGRMSAGTRAVSGLPAAALRSAARPLDSLATTWATGESLVKLLTPGTKRLSPVFKAHSDRWLFDTYELPMAELRRAAAAAGGTVNDVFMASVAGGLYRYHSKLGHEITYLRVNLPVSFRKSGDPVGGNRFTPVRFVVPVDEPDPRERVRQLGTLCRQWRAEPALPMTEAIADVLSRLPGPATTALLGSMMYGVDFVATNVPGIDQRCYIAGAEVLRQFAFAPLAGAAVNFSLVSHAGTACIGVNMDEASVPDPDLLMACLRDGFDEVTAQTE
ncbi:MAG TPA: wax ester/triacylglycerol synthase domain-containing protein [Acidimicrobiales bacterium]|nr:wax ester/triacylglycerol synthase domain-containing protein [Acidimicrobiales bacterium]